MRIIVCLKEVSDPEASAARFSVVPEAARVLPSPELPRVVSLYDEHAMEAAVQLKESVGGEVIAVTLGEPSAEAILRRALALGADRGVLLSGPPFEGLESQGTAYALSRAVRRIGEFQLVICGQQSADGGSGVVGPALAHFLDIVSVTGVRAVQPQGGGLRLERSLQVDEVIECPLPALVTVGSEINKPRYPALKAFMAARRKEIACWSAAEIGIDGCQLAAYGGMLEPVDAFLLETERRNEIIGGDTPAEAGAALVARLRQDHVI